MLDIDFNWKEISPFVTTN